MKVLRFLMLILVLSGISSFAQLNAGTCKDIDRVVIYGRIGTEMAYPQWVFALPGELRVNCGNNCQPNFPATPAQKQAIKNWFQQHNALLNQMRATFPGMVIYRTAATNETLNCHFNL